MEPLGPGDARAFQYLSLIVIGTGLLFSLLFHVMVRESSDEELRSQEEEGADLLGPAPTQRTIRCWLTNKKFYLVSWLTALCYYRVINVCTVSHLHNYK